MERNRARLVAGMAIGALICVMPNGTAADIAIPSRAAGVCAWGGNPAAATGTVEFKPGVTNTPAERPIKFVAKGPIECTNGFSGDMTLDGVLHAGSTCVAQIFEGKVKGLPGVASFFGPGAGGFVHEFLYDKDGNLVGADQPQVLSGATAGGSELADCNTDRGFTETVFSSTVQLWR